MSGGAAMARLAGETSDNMKKPNDGKGLFYLEARLHAALCPHGQELACVYLQGGNRTRKV
jgi:hypothetical protein